MEEEGFPKTGSITSTRDSDEQWNRPPPDDYDHPLGEMHPLPGSRKPRNPRKRKLWLVLPLVVVIIVATVITVVVTKGQDDSNSSNDSLASVSGTTTEEGSSPVASPTADKIDKSNPAKLGGVQLEAPTVQPDVEPEIPISPIQLPVFECPETDEAIEIISLLLKVMRSDELCTLIILSADEKSFRQVARSYSGGDWEASAAGEDAMEISCSPDSSICNINLPNPPDDGSTYRLKSFVAPAYSNRDVAARFLEQTTFGITSAGIDELVEQNDDENVFAEWIMEQQQEMPVFSHRALYRRYLNSKAPEASPLGRTTQPCEKDTRFRRSVFSNKDIDTFVEFKTVSVNFNGATREYRSISKVNQRDGTTHLYTMVDKGFKRYDWEADAYVTVPWEDGKYHICWVHQDEFIYVDHPTLGECQELQYKDPEKPDWDETAYHSNPPIFFPVGSAVSINQIDIPSTNVEPIEVDFFESTDFSNPLQEYLVTSEIQDPQCPQFKDAKLYDGPVFGVLGDSYLVHDPRFKLLDNTLEEPLSDGGGEVFAGNANLLHPDSTAQCSNVPRTFLNEDTCYLSTSPLACAYPTKWQNRYDFEGGGTFEMTEEIIRIVYEMTGAGTTPDTRYWYAVEGLDQARDPVASKPCAVDNQSRWLPVQCDNTALASVDSEVRRIFSELIGYAKADEIENDSRNPYMLDVWLWSGYECPASQMDVFGFDIRDADGECWRNVHPDHLNVYDFTYWAGGGHPGNSAARNPIAEFAEAGSVRLVYPSWHEMTRWHNYKGASAGPWRLGDRVSFYSLPENIRNEQMAEILGVELVSPGDPSLEGSYGSLSGVGTVVCGSPNEVANEPTLGGNAHRGAFDADSRYFATQQELLAQQALLVWTKAIMDDPGQLRQRIAWALSQILVVSSDGVDTGGLTEVLLSFYDIFVRNAFGSYRDVLKEVSYSPLMANMLTYFQGRSTAFVFEEEGNVEFADENFAREVMQLFTTGLFRLHMNGTQVLDQNGEPERVYTNADIEEYARAWTGFIQQEFRGNAENVWDNFIDPMKIFDQWRDRFPKMGLDRKYVGDGYPLCADLPSKHFLRKGATYRLLGNTPLPELQRDSDEWATDPAAKRMSLDSANSGLYEKLCDPQAGGTCNYKGKIVLDEDVTCDGDECLVDAVRTVEVSDGIFYEYIRAPCVNQAFYDDAKTIIRAWEWGNYMCADPRTEAAVTACCSADADDGYFDDVFWGERVKFDTALESCNQQLCSEWPRPECGDSTKCWNRFHYWTNEPCTLRVNVNQDGKVGIVHAPYTNDADTESVVSRETKTFFRVDWTGDQQSIYNNCDSLAACSMSTEDDLCLCDVSVSDSAVFGEDANPSPADILTKLHIGGFDATPLNQPITMHTVFEVTDDMGVVHLRKNVQSMVTIAGTDVSFRNPPHFISLSDEESRDAHFETDAVLDHYFYHPNTAPFLAIRFAQRFGLSNPSPRFVEQIASAFKSGEFIFESGTKSFTFGNDKYGDLAATIAAVLLDPESRNVILDADPTHGSLKEPVLKITGMMRALDFKLDDDEDFIEFREEMGIRIGQMAHELPNVFSFFLPEFQPSGPISQSNLVAPEAQVLTSPRQVSAMNGFFSLARHGLTDCFGGYGRNRGWCSTVSEAEVDEVGLGFLEYEPQPSASNGDIVGELSTLLTAGRLSNDKRDLLTQIMDDSTDAEKAMKNVQQVLASAPEFHTTNLVRTTEEEREETVESAPSTRPYKAIVYILLDGGVDSFNMLAPHTCTQRNVNGLTLLEQYNAERTTIALTDEERYRIIQATDQPCEEFAIHPDLPVIEKLYSEGDLAFFANMGVLDTPVTQENYYAATRTELFAHNTMQQAAQRIDSWDSTPGTGILGRVCDVLAEKGFSPQPITIEDATVATVGVPGRAIAPLIVSTGGPEEFNPRSEDSDFAATEFVSKMNKHTDIHSSVFGETWSQGLHKAIADNAKLIETLQGVQNTQNYGEIDDENYRGKFQTISNLIGTREARGVDRDVFFTKLGFWDHHGGLRMELSEEFQKLNSALDVYQKELKAQGLWDQVTLVVTSDFARTLTANSGEGSDHAWGGNYFAMGGSVKGGKIHGDYPHDITPSGPFNIGRGRLIPTLSYESMLNGITEWFGIEEEEELEYCMPNRLGSGARLFSEADIFENSRRLRGTYY